MIKLFGAFLLATSSLAYAVSPAELPLSVSTLSDKSMKDAISQLADKAPIENATIVIYAGNIAGPIKVLETNSCLKAVEYLKPRVGDKPMLIMDGGYTVHINQPKRQFVVKSSDDSLFSWINRCIEKFELK